MIDEQLNAKMQVAPDFVYNICHGHIVLVMENLHILEYSVY